MLPAPLSLPFDMQFFRLLHRQTKSEGDVSTLVSTGVTAPVFVPLQVSLPSFDPANELYASPTDSSQAPVDSNHIEKLNAKIVQMESQLDHLRDERSSLERDLIDYRTDLLQARKELYSEMLCGARHQQRAMDEFTTIQKLEARHQRFYNLLVDVGIPHSTVDMICQVIRSGNGSPDDILVNAIRDALNDSSTLLSRIKPVVTDERTPEHYQSVLNLTLSVRKELKSQKKRSKFWKKLAQADDRHANTITPSPSDISSIRQDLSPQRQSALESLITRRREAKNLENADSDVFGGKRRISVLDTLASSLASRPRHSVQDNLRLSSSFSSSDSSASTTYFSYLSGRSQIPRDSAIETPVIPSHLPSPLSTSLRRSSRGSSQSIVLGSINLNVSRSSSIDPILPEETELHTNPENGIASTITLSQDLLQNARRASQGYGHHRVSSTSSRRSAHPRSISSSFRLSAFSPIRPCRLAGPPTAPDLDVSGNTTIDASSFHTPDALIRLSDLVARANSGSDTPASSDVTRSELEDTPFNDARALPKYGADTPFSLTELEPRVASTPLDEGSVTCKLSGNTSHDTRFLDSSMSMTMSVSASEPDAGAQDRHGNDDDDDDDNDNDSDSDLEHDHDHEDNHPHTDSGTGTIPVDESKDSLFTTTSTSSLSANETPAPATPPTPSPSPVSNLGSPTSTGKTSIGRSMLPVLVKHLKRLSLSGTSPDRERLVGKFRGLRSLSRSRSGSSSGSPPVSLWRGSPARSESSRSGNPTPSPSPVRGSGIPVLQRRMTIRARRTSMRKI